MTQADDHPHAPTRLADVVLTIPEQRNQLFATPCKKHSRNHCPNFTIPYPCFFPLCLVGTLQIPSGATKGGLRNGTVSNRGFLSGCCFGCRGVGLNPTRPVSIRLERFSKRRGTLLPGGHALH